MEDSMIPIYLNEEPRFGIYVLQSVKKDEELSEKIKEDVQEYRKRNEVVE